MKNHLSTAIITILKLEDLILLIELIIQFQFCAAPRTYREKSNQRCICTLEQVPNKKSFDTPTCLSTYDNPAPGSLPMALALRRTIDTGDTDICYSFGVEERRLNGP